MEERYTAEWKKDTQRSGRKIHSGVEERYTAEAEWKKDTQRSGRKIQRSGRKIHSGVEERYTAEAEWKKDTQRSGRKIQRSGRKIQSGVEEIYTAEWKKYTQRSGRKIHSGVEERYTAEWKKYTQKKDNYWNKTDNKRVRQTKKCFSNFGYRETKFKIQLEIVTSFLTKTYHEISLLLDSLHELLWSSTFLRNS